MNPYAICGALLLLIATWFGGEYRGAKLKQAEWDKDKLVVMAQHQKELKDEFNQYASDLAIQQGKARKASKKYEEALQLQDQKHRDLVADIRRTGGLRIRSTCPVKVGPAPATEAAGTSGPDESAAGTERLPAEVENGLLDLVGDADKVSEQLRALQGWVRDNGFYGPPPVISVME